ncbi:MAG: hypothetical protein JWQ72_3096 [Polaromonas sp.]|nr:hypothetical protein [Polaromonas sp.]
MNATSHRPPALFIACVALAGSAMAAQPAERPAPTLPGVHLPVVMAPIAPGLLKGFTAAGQSVVADQPLNFTFGGTGHCKLKLTGGDGYVKDVEGDLPFSAAYTYGTGSMSSYDAFKDYSASVTPVGNCKIAAALPPVTVRVVNPSPQGVPAAGAGNPAGMAVSALKPGMVQLNPVLATLTSLAFPSKPSAGGPTLLTVLGTGNCKYHLSYVNLDAQGNLIVKQYPMVPKASSAQTPFPMSLKMMDATPAGVYKWTATAAEGCSGSVNVTFAVQ